MSKILRKTLLQFGSTVNAGSEIGQFGSYAAPIYTADIATLQAGTAWPRGWAAETIATNRPFLEDMNAVDYVYGYMLSYLMQDGIPEYDSGTTYYIGSVCKVGKIPYVSLTDANIGNTPSSSPSNWSVSFAQTQGADVASATTLTLGNDGNSFKITGTTTISSLTTKPAGSLIRIIFTGVLTVLSGSNLNLNGNFTTTPGATLTLWCDGSTWYEMSRSPVGGVDLSTNQTIGGIKTFTSPILSSVNLNGGSISNGSMGRSSLTLKSLGNGEDWVAPAGSYICGGHRDPDGSFGGLYYAFL